MHDSRRSVKLLIDNPWFSGSAEVETFTNEELLATKFRAFLQRDKGRDLFDLQHAFDTLDGLDPVLIVDLYRKYMEEAAGSLSRAQAESLVFGKLKRGTIFADIRPLLSPSIVEEVDEQYFKRAAKMVLDELIARLPGEPWKLADSIRDELDLDS